MREIADHDLIAYALGRLDGAARERLERALARDEALARRQRAIRDHLARYETLGAPPPPPFARIAERLGEGERRVGAWPVWAAAALVALLLVGVGLLGRPRDATAPLGRAGAGVYVVRGADHEAREDGVLRRGDLLGADEPAELSLGGRVRIVLDGGARLRLAGADEVRLESGRAFFEVDGVPFAVTTPAGTVRVTGTAFEVALPGGALEVAVQSGRVDAAGTVVEAGEALSGGRVAPLSALPGAFFRRPSLDLAAARARSRAGDSAALVFTFANQGRVAIDLAGPDGVRAALWLQVVTPDGEVHDVAVPAAGALVAGRPLHLGPLERIAFALRVQGPFGVPGTYRLRAMYRPEGQTAVVSDVLELEVR